MTATATNEIGAATQLAFKPHPLLPLPPLEQLQADLADPAKREGALLFLQQRTERLRWAQEDPLHGRLRLPMSNVVDELLKKYQVVYESGGKRAGKTADGIPRFVECCLKYPNSMRWAMQDNETSSIANLQKVLWEYLPPSIKRLNNKRGNPYCRVVFTDANGFDGKLILPNRTQVHFLTYKMDPKDYLGWELGKPVEIDLDPEVPDIGALLDEDCTAPWLENVQLRCSTRGSKIHWMYSPQNGITPTIKQLRANAVTIQSRPAELLPDRVNMPGLPRGHMPFIQVDAKANLAIVYRFTEWNPFSGYDRPGGVKQLCLSRNDSNYTKQHAYGYCDDIRGRAFPLFGEWNIVPPENVPAEGTNWMVTDPQGARNWYTLWARCAPGNPGDLYIYREWPDFRTYGEWAVISANPKKLNGERGPAQPTIGYGPAEYKARVFLENERILVPARVKDLARLLEDGGSRMEDGGESERHLTPALSPSDAERETGLRSEATARQAAEAGPADDSDVWASIEGELAKVKDLQWRRRIKRAIKEGEDLGKLQEDIFERLIDPRAATNQTAAEGKGICVLTKLLEVNTEPKSGQLVAPSMAFTPAPGLEIREGLTQINSLLFFDKEREMVPILNMPRIFIASTCRNLIWAMQNYSLPTDTSTADDACEDPIDCLRYLVTRGVRYILPGGKVKTRGGGSY